MPGQDTITTSNDVIHMAGTINSGTSSGSIPSRQKVSLSELEMEPCEYCPQRWRWGWGYRGSKIFGLNLLVYLGLKFVCFIRVYHTRGLQQTVQSGSYVTEHTSYSARHADVKFPDTNSCYLVAYLNDTLNSSTFRMNEMRPSAGAGGEVWCGWAEVGSAPVPLRGFFIPLIKVNFYIIPRFLTLWYWSVPFRTGWQNYVALNSESALKATPTSVLFIFLSSLIQTWPPCKPVSKGRQRSSINLCKNYVLLSAPFPTLIPKYALFWDTRSVV
jgi:hypothetical protein